MHFVKLIFLLKDGIVTQRESRKLAVDHFLLVLRDFAS